MIMTKINIMICDDEQSVHDEVCNLICKYKNTGEFEYGIYNCYSGDELLKSDVNIHILFLDIEMPGKDGIEIGKILCQKGSNARIIMLTAKKERFKECFRINATRFVTKPIDKGEFYEALDSALFSFAGSEKIELRYNDQKCMVNQQEIIIAESKGGYLLVRSKERVYDTNESLKELETKLDQRLFISPCRGIIINMMYINRIKKANIYMDDGTLITISRRKMKSTIQKIVDFDKIMGA